MYKTFRSRAEDVAAIYDLYSITNSNNDNNQIEKMWTGYEGGLATAVTHLIEGTVDGEEWLRVLVPFITGFFVRGFDYAERKMASNMEL